VRICCPPSARRKASTCPTALLRAANLSQGDSMVDGCRAVLAKKDKVLDKMNFPEAFPYVWSVADVR
jgi:hypothetical protein